MPACSPSVLARCRCSRGGGRGRRARGELGHAHVHVGRAPQRRTRPAPSPAAGPLVGAHRLAEPALRDADVGQGDRAPDDVGRGARPAPGSPCPRRTTGAPPRDPRSSSRRGPGAPRPTPRRDGRPRRTRSSARRAWCMVPATSPAPGPARRGTRRSRPAGGGTASSSTTTISTDRASVAPSAVAASQRSASRRRASTPSSSPLASSAPAYPTLSTGRSADHARRGAPRASAEQRGLLPAPGASPARPARPGPPRARQSPAASAWRIASDGSPCCSYHALARRCSSGTRSGCSSSRCARSTSAKRWW